MSTTPHQPTIPSLPEGEGPSEAEVNFIEDSPPDFFPDNPESNFGLKRRLWSEQVQEIINQLDLTYLERFPTSADQFLDEWERMMGIPVGSPVTAPEELLARRNTILSRLRKAPFSEQLIMNTLEGFLAATFGGAAIFTPEGIAVDALGIPLYSEGGTVGSMYRIYQNPENFSYEVWIRSDVVPDMAAVTRELNRITPAGITPIIDGTHANILDYMREVRESGPTGWWRLGANFQNSTSLTGLNGTAVGGVVAGSGPALALNSGDTSTDFDGTNHYVSIASVPSISPTGTFSVEAWVRPDAFPTNHIMAKTNSFGLYCDPSDGNKFGFVVFQDPNWAWAMSLSAAQVGQKYHVVGTFDATTIRLYVNGVLQQAVPAGSPGPVRQSSSPLQIGARDGASRWNGVIDEAAFYSFTLPEKRIKRHYNTGTNVP